MILTNISLEIVWVKAFLDKDGGKQCAAKITRKQIVYWYKKGGRNFSNMDLSGLDLSNLKLQNINLSGSDLRGVDFSGSNLDGSNMKNVMTNIHSTKFTMTSMDNLVK